jgi:hypothetical protein
MASRSHPLSFRHRSAVLALAAATVGATVMVGPPSAFAGGANSLTVTMRVSTDSAGGQPKSGGSNPRLSGNGRFLAFDDIETQQTWVEDLLAGSSRLVSTTPAGAPANQSTVAAGVSADGTKVAFLSDATNLAPPPHVGTDLYVRDLVANTTTRANIAVNNAVLPVWDYSADLADSGNLVVFTDLIGHTWARRLFPANTQPIDVSSNEAAANAKSWNPRVSADGNHAVFTSAASNLVTGDTNGFTDVFERNLDTGTTVRVSLRSAGVQLTGPSDLGSLSGNGKTAAFASTATNAVSGDTNGASDVFVTDIANKVTLRDSQGPGNVQANQGSDHPVLSDDGAWMVFRSTASNLVANDTNNAEGFFKRPINGGSPTAVDVSSTGVLGNKAGSGIPAINADGTEVAFASTATNLVSADTNATYDVFVRRPETIGPHSTMLAIATDVLPRFGASTSTSAADAAKLADGRLTVPHYLSTLAHAPAWATDRGPVARLYTAFFNRQPDLGGLTYWAHKHATGTDLGPIATQFAKSSEFKTKYGSVSNGTFVNLIYGNVLQRKPDSAGLAHWTAKLDAGTTRGAVMVQFSESSEGKRTLARSVDPTLIGLGLTGKMLSTTDFAAAQAAFDLGGSEGVADLLVASDGYAAAVK